MITSELAHDVHLSSIIVSTVSLIINAIPTHLAVRSLHLVTKAEFAAQIFRNALVRHQETDIRQLLIVARLCLREHRATALSVLLKVTAQLLLSLMLGATVHVYRGVLLSLIAFLSFYFCCYAVITIVAIVSVITIVE